MRRSTPSWVFGVSLLAACDGALDGTGGSGTSVDVSTAAVTSGTESATSGTGAGGGPVEEPQLVDPPASNVTVVKVDTVTELLEALAIATPGSVVEIDPAADLDLSAEQGIVIPAYVTLSGGGARKGEGGAHVFTDTKDTPALFVAGGPGVRITGMRITGPDSVIGTSSYGEPISRGIRAANANGFRVDNSELSAFAHTAVLVDLTRRARIDNNFIHHNRRYGLGYGTTLVRDSEAIFEYNDYDANRHSIAATGRPNLTYVAHHNHVGPTRNGHAFDMHGENEALDNGAPWAGTLMRMFHNTFAGTKAGILVRGRPRVGAYIDDNCFGQSAGAGTAIRQSNFTGNMFIGPNKYSQANGTCHEGRAPAYATRGDINGDQHADVVTLVNGTVYPFLGQADGTLVPAPPSFDRTMKTALFGGPGHLVIDVADVDGDLLADVVTANTDGNVYVYPGRPGGTFGPGVASFAGTYRVDLRDPTTFEPIGVGDVDGDGRGDLVSIKHGSAYIHPGNADGTFGAAVERFEGTYDSAFLDGVGHYAIDVADVNGDGRADLVTLHSSGTGYVYPGLTTGTFGSSVQSFHDTMNPALPDGEGYEPVGVGDVNGDGRGDLVTVHTDGSIYVYPGLASGAFTSRVESFDGAMKSSLFGESGFEVIGVLDVTGDARVDLVVVDAEQNLLVAPATTGGKFGELVPALGGFRTARTGDHAYEPLNEKSFRRRLGCTASGCSQL